MGENEEMKRKKRAAVICVVMALFAVLLGACGGVKSQEELIAEMKEFSSPDASYSLYFDQKWKEEDLGLASAGINNWLCVSNDRGTEIAVVMQLPKSGAMQMASSMDEVKDLVESSYGVSSPAAVSEIPTVPGMTNLTAVSGTAEVDGSSAEVYIVYGETDYAYYAVMYGYSKIGEAQTAYIKASLSKFVETAPEEEDNSTVEITDTIRWFNASYAVLTELNGWDYGRFGGLAANDDSMAKVQGMLNDSWDVTDRASADETLDWILTEGHRLSFQEDMQTFEEVGIADVGPEERVPLILDNFYLDEDEAQMCADWYSWYEQYGADAVAGWDYCRAMNLLSFYYIAGYYTEQEALDKSMEIAAQMQPLFGSWDELMDSYLRGYEYWAEESSDERRGVYEDLKSRSDNPYVVDYNMTFEKTW